MKLHVIQKTAIIWKSVLEYNWSDNASYHAKIIHRINFESTIQGKDNLAVLTNVTDRRE